MCLTDIEISLAPSSDFFGPHLVNLSVQENLSIVFLDGLYILLHASKVGSPTDHPGSRQRQDTGPGKTDRTFDPFLLRQGEPSTSQYRGKKALNCALPEWKVYMDGVS